MMQVDADQRPSIIGPPFTGHFRVICDTPRGLQPWQPAAESHVVAGGKAALDDKVHAKTASKAELNIDIGRNIYEPSAREVKLNKSDKQANGEDLTTNGGDDTFKSIEDAAKEDTMPIHCFSCGIDCTRVHYHYSRSNPASTSVQKFKYDICPNCYGEGRMPSNQSQSDYIKVENPTYASAFDKDTPWSDGEVLRLLEAMERYDDNWDDVAEHVGSRTREECVIKFLQFEIEDKYIDTEPTGKSTGISMLGPQSGNLPFSQADNPVMSVLSFLAGLTEPSVTAAAAGKSVDTLKQSLRAQLEKPSSEGDKAQTSSETMDVDIKPASTPEPTTLSALATVPLAAMSARAGALASHEEREMTRLVSAAVNTTLTKLELKLKQFNEMEQILQKERRELERGRQQLLLDRLAFKKRVREVQQGFKTAAATGGDVGARMAAEVAAGTASGERLAFQNVTPGHAASGMNVQPLSAEGQIKSYDL